MAELKFGNPLTQEGGYCPTPKGKLQLINEDKDHREGMIWYSLWTYGFLIPRNVLFRLCYFSQVIREHYDCVKNKRIRLIADLLVLNSKMYAPFYRNDKDEFCQPDELISIEINADIRIS
jgi:hypothetical protein